MIYVTFNDTDRILVSEFESRSQKILSRIAERMTLSMERLQESAREKLAASKSNKYPENPDNPSTGELSESISNPRVEVSGTEITGKLDWGGDLPYARIQEEGGELPVINPLGARKEVGRALGGTRKHIKGATRVFGSDVLKFMGAEGKFAYRPATFPGPIPAKHFMQNAVAESITEIKTGIQEILDIAIQEK